MNSVNLVLQGLGHVPSFKNKKRAILDHNTGQMRTLTDKKTKLWMQRATHSFASQLRYGSVITEVATLTAPSPPSSIVSFPLDDSFQWIPEIHVKALAVCRGSEGCRITIERIT